MTVEQTVSQIIQTNFLMWCKDKERAIFEVGPLGEEIKTAINAAKAAAREQALEDAAKVAENTGNECVNCLESVALWIRALKRAPSEVQP